MAGKPPDSCFEKMDESGWAGGTKRQNMGRYAKGDFIEGEVKKNPECGSIRWKKGPVGDKVPTKKKKI